MAYAEGPALGAGRLTRQTNPPPPPDGDGYLPHTRPPLNDASPLVEGGTGFTVPPYAFHHMHAAGFLPPAPGLGVPMYGYGIPASNPMLGGAETCMPGTFGGMPIGYPPHFANGIMFGGIPVMEMSNPAHLHTAMPMPPPGQLVRTMSPGGNVKKPLGRPRKYPLPDAGEVAYGISSGIPSKKEAAPHPQLKSRLKPPKQSPSAWQFYFAEELQKTKAASPAERLNVAQAAKEAGQRYAALPESERQRYQEQSREAKKQYEADLAAWREKLTPEDIRQENLFRSSQRKLGKSRRGNLRDPNAPKKPLSAYFLFLRTIRTNPEMSKEILGSEHETTKQSVLAAAKWRTLSEEEKRPYMEQADQDKAEYEELRRKYAAKGGGVPPSEPKADLPERGEAPLSPPDASKCGSADTFVQGEASDAPKDTHSET